MPSVGKTKGGVEFDLRVDPPLKAFQFRVSRFVHLIGDWRGFFGALSEWFKAQQVKRFATEGAWGGGKWAPVDPEYARRKREAGFGSVVGVRTGALRASQTGGAGYSEAIKSTSASFGMSASSKARPYGEHFNALRQVIRMDSRQGREAQKLTHQWVLAEVRNAGIGGASLPGAIRATGWTGAAATGRMSAARATGGL
jgi:hypothetical protein